MGWNKGKWLAILIRDCFQDTKSDLPRKYLSVLFIISIMQLVAIGRNIKATVKPAHLLSPLLRYSPAWTPSVTWSAVDNPTWITPNVVTSGSKHKSLLKQVSSSSLYVKSSLKRTRLDEFPWSLYCKVLNIKQVWRKLVGLGRFRRSREVQEVQGGLWSLGRSRKSLEVNST